jgi:hypothetical protein
MSTVVDVVVLYVDHRNPDLYAVLAGDSQKLWGFDVAYVSARALPETIRCSLMLLTVLKVVLCN